MTLTHLAEQLSACSVKGTLFLMLVGLLALRSGSASRRHFVWACGLAGLVALLLLNPIVPHLRILPAWKGLGGWMQEHAFWLVGIWLAGAGCLLARTALGMLALRRLRLCSTHLEHPTWRRRLAQCQRSIGVGKRVHLLQHPGWVMPMTWGLLRSFIVVPSASFNWSAQRTRTVLMHELAHIRRRDFITTMFQDLVCALFWFHPLVWWMAREMDEDREEACDDVVLAAGETPARYAGHLASVATHGQFTRRHTARPLVALARKPLRARVGSILAPWKSRHPMRWAERLQVGLTVTALLWLTAWIDFRPAHAAALAHPTRTASLEVASLPHAASANARREPAFLEPAGLSRESRSWNLASVGPLVEPSISGHVLPEATGWKALQGAPLPPATFGFSRFVETPVTPISALMAGDPSPFDGSPRTPLPGAGVVEIPDYSTPPPDEDRDPRELDGAENPAEGGGLTGDLLPNLLNVDFGGLFGAGDAGSDAIAETPGESNDFFAPLALGSSHPQPLPGTTKTMTNGFAPHRAERLDSLKRVETVPRPDSAKNPQGSVNQVVSGQPQRSADPGVIADGHLVKNLKTSGKHLAITFRRKPNSQTALYRVEASKDLVHWDGEAGLFALAYVREIEGRQAVTVIISEPLDETSYRYLRVRSSYGG